MFYSDNSTTITLSVPVVDAAAVAVRVVPLIMAVHLPGSALDDFHPPAIAYLAEFTAVVAVVIVSPVNARLCNSTSVKYVPVVPNRIFSESPSSTQARHSAARMMGIIQYRFIRRYRFPRFQVR